MKQVILKIIENTPLTNDVYKMVLSGDTSEITRPGQFINFRLSGFYLRRPISVCDYGNGTVTVIYKVVGEGTKYMSKLEKQTELDVLCGLGNGFDTSLTANRPVLIGGGVGTPPMYNLAKVLLSEEKNVTVILGFNDKSQMFYEDEFIKLGANVLVTTADGSYGIRGFVTDALKTLSEYTYICACGPEPMLKAVYNASNGVGGQYSFEERMGCGFGACMGCSCKTKYGYKRICKDGPVLFKEEIVW